MTESHAPWRPGVLVGDLGTSNVVYTLSNVLYTVPMAILQMIAEYTPPLRIPWRALMERNCNMSVRVPINNQSWLDVEYKMPSGTHIHGSVSVHLWYRGDDYNVFGIPKWSIYEWIHSFLVKPVCYSEDHIKMVTELLSSTVRHCTVIPDTHLVNLSLRGSRGVVFYIELPLTTDHAARGSLLRVHNNHGYDVVCDDIKACLSEEQQPKTCDEQKAHTIREMHYRRLAQWINAVPLSSITKPDVDSPLSFVTDWELFDRF